MMLNEAIGAELIKGAYDLHLHSAPDVLPRIVDDMEMARRITALGMKGFAAKNHFFCTAPRAQLVKKAYPGCNAVGTICLNNAVGGVNPIAVELAARCGTKLVWFPTCDALWERQYAEKEPGKKAFWAKIVETLQEENIEMPGISLLDENGKLKRCVYDVLEVVKKNKMTICTGHISHQECFALISEAHRMVVERMIVTHVSFPSTFYTEEQQKTLIAQGAYMEQSYSTYATGKVTFEAMLRQIKAAGAKHVVLGTDLGQPTRDEPEAGLLKFLIDLYEGGVAPDDIRQMVSKNGADFVEA